MVATDKEVRDMLLERVRALLPRIRELEDQMEAERRLPLELADAMVDAGLYQMWVPKSLGGFELDFLSYIDVIEEMARVSGAAAWNLMIGSSFGYFAGLIPEDAAAEIYRDTKSVLAGQINATNGRAVVTDGGYRVSGHWAFGSGILQATWVVSNAFVFDGDQPRLKLNGEQEVIFVITPASDVTIHDTWYTMGFRGTGSNDYSIDDVFVPESRAFVHDVSSPRYQPGILYKVPGAVGPPLAVPPLGVAWGALDAMKELAATRKSRQTGLAWRDDPVLQYEIARAESVFNAGRSALRDALREMWEELEAGDPASAQARLKVSMATKQAVLSATQCMDILFEACGGTAVYTKNPLERRFRDIHTVRQHAGFGRDRTQQIGLQLLGLDIPELRYRA